MQTPLAMNQGRIAEVNQAGLRGATGTPLDLDRSGPGRMVGDPGG
jgi:hypothetical protein